jgi:hypothetical protein
LRFPHNVEIFENRYGSSRARWIREGLVPELTSWGFNTIGWTSEYVSGSGLATSGQAVDLGHSAELPAAELSTSGMPYTLSLRVTETEHWNGHPAFRDPRSAGFEQWCDHLARTTCRPDDPNLLGYFLVDAPSWSRHPTGAGYDHFHLAEIAEAYFATASKAIRRHDERHLLFGDRLGTRADVPAAVLDAAARHLDVLSVQTFPTMNDRGLDLAMARINAWHERTGLPVLIADTGNWAPTIMSPERTGSAGDQDERGRWYTRLAESFAESPWILGWHWCSWIENPQRGFGLKDPWDEPYRDMVSHVSATNQRLLVQFHTDAARRP